jgi:CopG family transcriptional regulator/antitoxin EndoAI
MSKRINIVLPEETVRVLDRVAPKGNRSRLISDAIMYYVRAKAKNNLAERLKQGYLANAQRDLEITKEWFPLDEEAWRHRKPTRTKK